jgi:hypothetical protein
MRIFETRWSQEISLAIDVAVKTLSPYDSFAKAKITDRLKGGFSYSFSALVDIVAIFSLKNRTGPVTKDTYLPAVTFTCDVISIFI